MVRMVNYKLMLLRTIIIIHKASKAIVNSSASKFRNILSGMTDYERSSSERKSGVVQTLNVLPITSMT